MAGGVQARSGKGSTMAELAATVRPALATRNAEALGTGSTTTTRIRA